MISSWAQKVSEQHQWLHLWLRSRAAGNDPIDDLVQDTLQSAIAQGPPQQKLHDVKGWLAGIAKNKLRQHIDRSIRERRLKDGLSGDETSSSAGFTPSNFIAHRERHDLLINALSLLTEKQASLLRAKYFDGASYQEIADRFQLSISEVTNRLRSARHLLRKSLEHLSRV